MDEEISLRISLDKKEVNTLPTTTGIYIFRNEKEIQYIGKSVNLKARINSHIENARLDAKEAAIINNSTKIECIITDSEFKALLLESRLIQKYHPPYNKIWRDDKSYLYIKISMKEDYPKIKPVRRENDGKSLYFGPFPSMRTVTEMLKEMRRVFPYCTQNKIGNRPCFYSKIHLCNPCPSEIEKQQDPELKKQLKKLYKNNIRCIVKVLEGNTDLVLNGLYKDLKNLTKEGKYEDALVLRNKIYRFERLIHQRLSVVDADPNYNQSEESITSLENLLRPYYPNIEHIQRIECYDISNMSMKEATASMVVLTDGLINKQQYRRFKIKDLKLESDFEMMNEVLRRRFNNKWEKPQLLVVDGGKPQVRVAMKVFHDLDIHIPLIGIAKHPDRIVIGQENTPTIRPKVQNLGFNLIRLIRDESHRFAKKYHLFLRKEKLMI